MVKATGTKQTHDYNRWGEFVTRRNFFWRVWPVQIRHVQKGFKEPVPSSALCHSRSADCCGNRSSSRSLGGSQGNHNRKKTKLLAFRFSLRRRRCFDFYYHLS